MVSGLAIYYLGYFGLAIFLYRAAFGISLEPPHLAKGFTVVAISVLSEIPILGPILFQQNILTYLGVILVPITGIILFKTSLA